MDKIHRPCLIDLNRVFPIVSQFGLHPAFRNLVTQLQTHFLIKAINPFWVHLPSFAPEQDMNAPIAVTHTSLTNISDLDLQISLIVSPRLVDIKRSRNAKSGASPSGRHFPI